VDFIAQEKVNTLIIPKEAVYKEKEENYVLVKKNNGKEPLPVAVKLGISDDKNTEIISGISANDRVVLKTKKYSLPKSNTGTNPFMPSRRR